MSRLDDLASQLGYKEACEILQQHVSGTKVTQDVLTIVVNEGVHHMPEEYLFGEVFYASAGNLNFSSEITVYEEYQNVLSNVARKLKSKPWKHIYIVPFGPSTLSMQIKLLVYRITRIDSIDLFYLGDGEYFTLELDQRNIIVSVD